MIPALPLKEFAELVQRMRLAQKKYFQVRTPDNLRTAKALEKQVDFEISNIIPVTVITTLF